MVTHPYLCSSSPHKGFGVLGWITLFESTTILPKMIWEINTLKTVLCEKKDCIFHPGCARNQRVGWAAYSVLEKGLTISF
jgi:hypothetical protein